MNCTELESPTDATPPAACGRGSIALARVNDRTVPICLSATSPLKLLTPRRGGRSAWIFSSTFGGGLVNGDSIDIDLRAGTATRTLLSTQASTKIYRSLGVTSRQALDASVNSGAVLISAPDPIVCFAGARYEQRQRFSLAPDASLVAIDWINSGRRARGERWAFDRYTSTNEIFIEDRCIFRDVLLLDPADGPLASPMRMGLVDSYASIVIVGPMLVRHVDELLKWINAQPISRNESLLFSAGPIERGAVLRIAGRDTESVGRWIRDRLRFVVELLGQDPWARKW